MLLAALEILKPEPGLAFWTVVTFFVLLIVLSRTAWKPILKMIAEREKTIADALAQAKHEREAAERLATEQRAAMEAARKETAELVRKNQAEVEKAKIELMAAARKEADALLVSARKMIEEEKVKAFSELRTMAVDLAMDAASRLVTASMDPQKQRALVEEYIQKLPAAAGPHA